MAPTWNLMGCELWPVPGLTAQTALSTSMGPATAFLSGPADARGAVILAGDDVRLIAGVAVHVARQGLACVSVSGVPVGRGSTVLKAAIELARQRGARQVAVVGHGAWTTDSVEAAVGCAAAIGVLDPVDSEPALPDRLRGIPLWVFSGTERRGEAQALFDRGRHPRALIELPGVPRLIYALNDVAAEIVPFVADALRKS